MNTFLHLVKYNLVFQRMRIAFLSVLVVLMVLLVNYFMETREEFGAALIQYSSYILFVIFTGKLNAKNSQMFDIKHLLAFPMTKREIIFTKSVADLVQMTPVVITFLWGVNIKYPQFHLPMVIVIFLLILTVMNINAFNKRIDFFRMQHSKSHFRNMFLYTHKYLELMIVLLFVAISVSIIFSVFGKNMLMLEYSLIILLTMAIFLSTMNALRMLKDETLSYFFYKRDIFRMGWKAMFVVVPGLLFHLVYQGKLTEQNLADAPASFREHLAKIPNIESQRFMVAAITSDEEYLEDFMAQKKPIPWDTEVRGMYPLHAAVFGDHVNLIEYMLELNPDAINKQGKHMKTTALFVAMRRCHLRSAELLIQSGINVNHQNKAGETALRYAMKHDCSGGVMRLIEAGANVELKDKKDVTDLAFLESQKDGLYEYLRAKEAIPANDFEKEIVRGIASVKKEKAKKVEAPAKPHESPSPRKLPKSPKDQALERALQYRHQQGSFH